MRIIPKVYHCESENRRNRYSHVITGGEIGLVNEPKTRPLLKQCGHMNVSNYHM